MEEILTAETHQRKQLFVHGNKSYTLQKSKS